jgi:diguanylate cyclase (GGDEF)-like protein/PAS domain S-box-containing protein
MAALWIAFQLRSETVLTAFWKKAGSALVMGAAISGMHFTGMAAAHFAPNSICTVDPQDINNVWLAGTIAGFTFMLLLTTLLISVFDARLGDRTAKLAETLRKSNIDLALRTAQLTRANEVMRQEGLERMEAETALRRSEERLRSAFNQSTVGIAHSELDGKLLQVNPKLCDMLGYSNEEMLALTLMDITHPDDRASGYDLRRQLLANEVQPDLPNKEKRYIRKDGATVWVSLTLSIVRKPSGDPDYVVTMVQDITESKAAEERFRATFEQAAVGMAMRDIDPSNPRWLRVNEKLCDILGYTREELLQLTSVDLTPPEDRAAATEYNEQLMRGEIASYSREKRYLRKDGTVIWADISLSAVRGPDGRPTHIMSVIEDISARKQAEEQLRKVDRARKVMAECSRVMVHASDEIQLLQDMCRIAVESGGYRMAWVGFAENDAEKSVRPVAQSGFDEGYLNASRISWGNNERGRGPSGRAIRTGEACVVRNVLTDPDFAPWRNMAIESGFRSHIALPLARQGTAFGVLSLYTAEVDAFDNDEVSLLEELAADLAYGIVSIRAQVEHARVEASLKASEELMRNTFDHAAVGIAHSSIDGRYLLVNHKLCEMLGYTRGELLAMSVRDIRYPDNRDDDDEDYKPRLLAGEITTHSAEKRYVRKDGAAIWANRTVSLVRDSAGNPIYFIRVIEDITERKQAEERLAYLAQYDSLTGLPNRHLFRDRLALAMARAKRNERMLAVMFLGLDHFKDINDTLGHTTGDEVLQAVAAMLRNSLRGMDTVARFGGDEFTIILENIAQVDQITTVVEKIRQLFFAAIAVGEREIFATASIGITIYPLSGEEIDALLRMAGVAMYHAKKMGRNNYEFYTPALNAQTGERLKMEAMLRRAVERNEFVLHYQPKVETATGRIIGVEALIRWNSKELGLIPPGQFIPLAEETGVIEAIGDWVIKTACAQSKAWQDQGLPPLLMSVNLSPRQLRQQNLVEIISGVLNETGLAPEFLDFEVTEGLLMENIQENIETLKAIRRLGVSLAIDDFGTGYSSLSYLARLPVQTLKIDRSFIVKMQEDSDAMALVSAILTLARSLGLKVVAEGVETKEQAKVLRLLRCDEIQGYLISAPVLAAELPALIVAQAQSEKRLA